MKKELKGRKTVRDHVGCYGRFQKDDPICKRYCALRIRCAIQQDQNARLEIMEDLVAGERTVFKIQ
jgi:hypothetical protein